MPDPTRATKLSTDLAGTLAALREIDPRVEDWDYLLDDLEGYVTAAETLERDKSARRFVEARVVFANLTLEVYRDRCEVWEPVSNCGRALQHLVEHRNGKPDWEAVAKKLGWEPGR